jgi:hypothetical protein
VLVAGPTAKNAGRKFYKCAACNTFEFVSGAAARAAPPTASTLGSAEYLVDEVMKRRLQAMFDVPARADLGTGRDYDGMSRLC